MKFRTHKPIKIEVGKFYKAKYTFDNSRPFYGEILEVKVVQRSILNPRYWSCNVNSDGYFGTFNFKPQDFIEEIIK